MPTALLTDEQTLLQDVLREPEADAPRLRYAEYLQHSAKPADQVRGEFIRLQINLARVTNAHPHWPAMIGRQRELLTANRSAWERPLRQRCRPKAPAKWLKSQLFGCGGIWGFQRGFVEQILAPADRFLLEDLHLWDNAPIRRIALTHASGSLELLANEPRLNRLDSLHLIGDMELDEDLQFLSAAAKNAGFTVLEFRFPRLREVFTESQATDPHGEEFIAEREHNSEWMQLATGPKSRLNQLLQTPNLRLMLDEPAPENTAAVLALGDWVFMGELLREANVWAVAKGYHDSVEEDGRCRRLLLLRTLPTDDLLNSPYFHAEIR